MGFLEKSLKMNSYPGVKRQGRSVVHCSIWVSIKWAVSREFLSQDCHRLEKYLKKEGFLEKSFK